MFSCFSFGRNLYQNKFNPKINLIRHNYQNVWDEISATLLRQVLFLHFCHSSRKVFSCNLLRDLIVVIIPFILKWTNELISNFCRHKVWSRVKIFSSASRQKRKQTPILFCSFSITNQSHSRRSLRPRFRRRPIKKQS